MQADDAPRRALIFANGDRTDGAAVQAALAHAGSAQIIAVDGGARLALAYGYTPDHVIGDMDSLTSGELADLEARGATLHRFPAEKDESDLELTMRHVVESGITWLRVIGATGSRLDQEFANVYLLTLDALAGCDARMVSGKQTSWVIDAGTHDLHGAPGDTISLLPLGGDAIHVLTEGLSYPLRHETLFIGPARGLSNVFEGEHARVTFEAGRLLVVHTFGTPD